MQSCFIKMLNNLLITFYVSPELKSCLWHILLSVYTVVYVNNSPLFFQFESICKT